MASKPLFNTIVKFILMGVSAVLAFIYFIELIAYFTGDDKPFSDKFSIIQFILILLGFVLSVLAFIGALIENSCLNSISVAFCFIMLLSSIWTLVKCFLNSKSDYYDSCQTIDYVLRSLVMIVLTIMLFSIYAFINSIEDSE
ncbi:uncharacterized protein LOC128961236 [Oppia nitens]|uniref:uncharacterized protein LOC128961236 n=1 Tax=Oppia nitens TaxID=1686743 RepID=UPI0023DCE251|nr:uncharacterized protein LOC128961236 [Oppia nitens]